MIKVALPNKGVLFEPTIDLLTGCGYRVSKSGGQLSSIDPESNIEFYFLRPGDIPVYVATASSMSASRGRTSSPRSARTRSSCWT